MEEEYKEGGMTLKKEAGRTFSRLGFAYAIFWIVAMLVQLGAGWLLQSGILPIDSVGPNLSVILSMGTMYLFGFPVFWLLCRRIPAAGAVKKTRWGLGSLAVCLIICIGAVYVGNLIGQLLMMMVGLVTGNVMSNVVQELIMQVNPWVILALTVIMAPVAEELMFRKLLIDRTIRYGQGISIVVSGILFGLAHGNFYQFFYACGLGMIFAYVYVKTGKIGYTITLHMIINFLGSILPIMLLKLIEKQLIVGTLIMLAYAMLIVGFVIAGIVLLIVYRRAIVLEPGDAAVPKGKRFLTVFCNFGMALYLAVCVAMFVMG